MGAAPEGAAPIGVELDQAFGPMPCLTISWMI